MPEIERAPGGRRDRATELAPAPALTPPETKLSPMSIEALRTQLVPPVRPACLPAPRDRHLDLHHDVLPYPVFPQTGGVLPWGIDTNGGVFYWRMASANPNHWPIVDLQSVSMVVPSRGWKVRYWCRNRGSTESSDYAVGVVIDLPREDFADVDPYVRRLARSLGGDVLSVVQSKT